MSILKTGAVEDKGSNARMQTFIGAIAVGDLVSTSFGPKGMDKLMRSMKSERQGGKHFITNDGATILSNVWIDNPAAKILIDLSSQQDATYGDGTTGVVLLAAELLKKAEAMIQDRIHPQVIQLGFHKACEIARKKLAAVAIAPNDESELRQKMLSIAQTTLSSKLLTNEKDMFSHLAVEAILRTRSHSRPLQLIQIVKKPGGSISQSYLSEGFVLNKEFGMGRQKSVKDCKVLLANTPMDTDKIKIYGAKVKVEGFSSVEAVAQAERNKIQRKVEAICKTGCNVFINRQLIYNLPDYEFNEKGVATIEHADFEGIEQLAVCLNGEIASTFDDPELIKLGHCDEIKEITVGDSKMLLFSGCASGGACTIILRGASEHILDEAERSLHDALAVLSMSVNDMKYVCGGGASEMAMACAIEEEARKEKSKVGLVMDNYAAALRRLPMIISDNAGYDSADLVSLLRSMHVDGNHTAGLDLNNGVVADMLSQGILETYKARDSQICGATEAAIMVVRVDSVIRSPPRERKGM